MLEKILEEIDREIEKEKEICHDLVGTPGWRVYEKAMKRAKDIICEHMNDGWIPVEERLPEDGENVLCTDGQYIYLVEYDADLDAGFGDMDGIIAWQPLPEPYNPGRNLEG